VNWWTQYVIGAVLIALQASIKNPERMATQKAVLLQIRDAINQLFPGE
jgi:hypothetical protein